MCRRKSEVDYIVNKETNCWEWQLSIKKNGYGSYRGGYAHREYYQDFKGNIPDGMIVMHKCDNRRCVNPDHLVLGTTKDNIHDMLNKGRGNFAKSEEHKRKLSEIGKTKIGPLNNGWGTKRTEESRQKMRDAKRLTREARANVT